VKLERQHGEAVRLIDLPAVFDGLDHIFDRLPEDFDPANFQDWKKDTFKNIADACEKDHGKAFRKYIKALIADRAELKGYIEGKIAYFVKHVCDEFDGDVARDVAAKIGLIYAAGMLGIRCGLLPWGRAGLLDALTKAYIGARDLLPDDGVAVRQGIETLRAKLRQLPRTSKTTVPGYNNIDGYRERQKKVNRYVIKRDTFRSLFASETQRALVIEWLIQKQRITLATAKTSAGAPAPKPQGQFVSPDGNRRRSVRILWPRKPKVTKAANEKEDNDVQGW
jgi:hypothetical protein